MTETHTIEAAYERLSTALAAPTGAEALVAARLVQRRRRRRTAQGASAALGVAAVVGGLALAGSGGDRPAPAPTSYAADTTSATAPSTGASTAGTDRCRAPLRPVGAPLPSRVQLTLDGLVTLVESAEQDGRDVPVEVVEDGDTTSFRMLDDDGRATYVIRARRDGDEWRALELLVCD